MKELENSLHFGAFFIVGIFAYIANILNSISASIILEGSYFYQISNMNPEDGNFRLQGSYL